MLDRREKFQVFGNYSYMGYMDARYKIIYPFSLMAEPYSIENQQHELTLKKLFKLELIISIGRALCNRKQKLPEGENFLNLG